MITRPDDYVEISRSNLRIAERIFGVVIRVAGSLPFILVILLFFALLYEALPVIGFNGIGFLFRSAWRPGNFYVNPVTVGGLTRPFASSYGAWPLIFGTIASSAIACVFAIPISISAAVLIVRKLPPFFAFVTGTILDLLAGIPSVLFGLWGALVFGPFFAKSIAGPISRAMPNVPILNYFKGPTGSGEGLLISGLVLSIMVIPIVASTVRELFRQVPETTREGAIALGLTDTEVVAKIDLRWVLSGIIGASGLGLGRALGETIAVAMVSGTVLGTIPRNIYGAMTTIAATIVTQLDSAFTDATNFELRTLAEAALILMLISLLVNMIARGLVKRVAVSGLPVGRGI